MIDIAAYCAYAKSGRASSSYALGKGRVSGWNARPGPGMVKVFKHSHCAMKKDLPTEDLRVIRIRDVIVLTGLSRSAIYAAVKAGTFPRQLKLSARSSGWLRDEVVLWVKERPRGV